MHCLAARETGNPWPDTTSPTALTTKLQLATCNFAYCVLTHLGRKAFAGQPSNPQQESRFEGLSLPQWSRMHWSPERCGIPHPRVVILYPCCRNAKRVRPAYAHFSTKYVWRQQETCVPSAHAVIVRVLAASGCFSGSLLQLHITNIIGRTKREGVLVASYLLLPGPESHILKEAPSTRWPCGLMLEHSACFHVVPGVPGLVSYNNSLLPHSFATYWGD